MRASPTLLAFAALVLAGGCANRRDLVAARYVPTSGDSSFLAHERARWKGDPQVFELPDNPPGVEDEHRVRNECARPGPQFKSQTLGGIADAEFALQTHNPPTEMGRLSDHQPGTGTGPWRPDTIGKQALHGPNYAVPATAWTIGLSGWDGRPRPMASVYPAMVQDPGKLGPDVKWDYCLEPEAPRRAPAAAPPSPTPPAPAAP